MAKRRRLTPANPDFLHSAAPEAPTEVKPPRSRAPIADVVAESSAASALEDVAGEMTRAREGGRLISRVALAQIGLDYLVRDRVVVDDEDMQALIRSIRDRGQQTPVEVAVTGAGRYGLISGWRRCQAIARLHAAGEGDGTVLILQRPRARAPEAYRAMVEENEIRAGLSYFERARIVVVAVDNKVFETRKKALQELFAAASRSKRSKIGSFIPVVRHLGPYLRFPGALTERLGLRLSRQLEPEGAANEDAGPGPLVAGLVAELEAGGFDSAEAETACLTRWVTRVERAEKAAGPPGKPRPPAPADQFPRAGLRARYHPGDNRLELSGEGLTEDLRAALIAWLAAQDDPSST